MAELVKHALVQSLCNSMYKCDIMNGFWAKVTIHKGYKHSFVR